MSIEADRERLSQKHNLEEMQRKLRLTDMVTVFQIDRDNLYHKRFIYSALIPDNQIEEALSDSDWDLDIGYGLPCEVSGDIKYLRYGVQNGVEPLVIHVGGYHPLDPWVEISEEFRLFHYLYYRDGKTDKYFRIDEGNEEVVVATVKPNHVQIRLREILQWLLLKDMSLSIQFRCWERSEHSVEDMGFDPTELQCIGSEAWEILHRDEFTCWRHSYADLRGIGIGDYQTDSKLEVKRIIKPVPISYERRYVGFIVSDHGDEYTCDDWQLLKPLSAGDEYQLQRLRIFAVNEESHFKDSISDLANILIERLNEKHLEVLIPVSKRKDIKRGINRLEYVLDFRNVEGAEKHITFLRCLWDLRNTRGGSHPELLTDSRYERASAHFDLENLNRPEAFATILGEAVEFLDFLISVVQSGKLDRENEEGR